MKPSVIVIAVLLHQVVGEGSTDVARASNAFANSLYKQIISTSEGNQLVCPVSLHVSLALLLEGAGGNTARQLANVIGISGANSDIKQAYNTVLSQINDNTLKIATKLYPAKGYQLNEGFVQVAKVYYYSGVEELDYNNPAEAANKINKDVEESTNNKIHDLISPDSLTSLTRLVLTNAVHFEAKWKQPFYSAYNGYFRVNQSERISTILMNQNGDFLYKDDPVLKAKVLKMDYDVGNYSMVFILPTKEIGNGLAEVEDNLSNMSLQDVLKDLKMTNVEVTIPKFTIEQTIDLKDILAKMCVTDLFTSNADLRKVANGDSLYVSKVVQKTFINVHENGTEAASATGFLETLSAIPDINVFNARRPFLFYLTQGKHPRRSLVLFQGRFVVPKEVKLPEDEVENSAFGFNTEKSTTTANYNNNSHKAPTTEQLPEDEDEDEDGDRFVLPQTAIRYPTEAPDEGSQSFDNFKPVRNQNRPPTQNQYSPQTFENSNSNKHQTTGYGSSQYSYWQQQNYFNFQHRNRQTAFY